MPFQIKGQFMSCSGYGHLDACTMNKIFINYVNSNVRVVALRLKGKSVCHNYPPGERSRKSPGNYKTEYYSKIVSSNHPLKHSL